MNDSGLVRIVNALEGYRIELLNPELRGESRALMEKVYHDTLVLGKEYGLPLTPYEHWLRRYLGESPYFALRKGLR